MIELAFEIIGAFTALRWFFTLLRAVTMNERERKGYSGRMGAQND